MKRSRSNSEIDTTVPAEKAPTRLFGNPNFRRMFAVGAIAMANQWLEMVAVSLFVYSATNSAMAVTLANLARALPMVLFGAIAGALADRLSRRKILMAAFSMLVLSSVVLGTLAFLEKIQIWHIFIGMFLTGVVFSTEFPIRRNMLGEIAGLNQIGRAMGFDSTARNATRILGPLLGGTLMEYVGLHGAYFIAAAFYALCLLQLRGVSVDFQPIRNGRPATYLANITEALQFVRREPRVYGFLLVTVVMNLFAFPYMTMVPVIGQAELKVSPLMIGILIGLEGLGATVGALFFAFTKPSPVYHKIYLYGSCWVMIAIIAFSFSKIYALSSAILFLGGLGMAAFSVMQATLPFLITPEHMRARVLGLVSVCIGLNPLGILLLGILAETIGPAQAITITASIGVLSMVGLTLTIREVR